MIKKIFNLIARIAGRMLTLASFGNISFYKEFIAGIEKKIDAFITYHLRPKYAVDLDGVKSSSVNNIDLAIVIQGALLLKDAFTLETVKLYKQSFPDASLIVSTWLGEDDNTIKSLRELDCIVLENDKTGYLGISNINLQIISSSNGIGKAKELGAEYVIKTRTDQRLYASGIADFLYNLTELFPVNGQCCQKKRIIGISLNTFKYRMYGLSDMFTYGYIDDMLRYWRVPLDMRKFPDNEKVNTYKSLRTLAEERLVEVYIVTEYMKKIGREIQWTLFDSWSVYKDYFIVIDSQQLDLFWPKYNRREFRWWKYSKDRTRQEEIGFRDWLNVYSGLSERDVPEEILDK